MTPQQAKVRAMLEAGPVTNGEFAEAGILRYSARIEELRKEHGLDIRTEGSGGTRSYRLEKRGGGSSPALSSLAQSAPASTSTCVLRDYTQPELGWMEVPTPAWALAGEGR